MLDQQIGVLQGVTRVVGARLTWEGLAGGSRGTLASAAARRTPPDGTGRPAGAAARRPATFPAHLPPVSLPVAAH